MSHTVWGTATGYVVGRFSTSNPTSDVLIRINNQFADLGDPEDLNTGKYYTWPLQTTLYYRPPGDAPAGFLNMSVVVDNWSQAQYMEPGAANFYPIRMPLDYRYDYTYNYNFASSLAGVSYSTLLLPVVVSVSPSLGSVAGGTVVTINGHGFSYNTTDMTVLVGGEPCTVLTVNPHQLTCVTGASSALTKSESLDQAVVNAINSGHSLLLNSSRPYGSAGAWIKVWNSTTIGSDSNAVFSFPWRNGLNFNFYYNFGGNSWPSVNGISSISTQKSSYLVFSLQIETVFIAPYSGRYKFSLSIDDYGGLYNASGSLIASTPGYTSPDDFSHYPSQTSKWIRLAIGQRYPLRVKSINTGYADQTQVAVRIAPDYASDGHGNMVIKDSLNPTLPSTLQYPTVVPPAQLPIHLLQHHAVREVQTISLSMYHQYEVQTVYMTGVTSGSFILVLQNQVVTQPIALTANIWQIQSSLSNAAWSLPYGSAECTSFSVQYQQYAKYSYKLVITFNVENVAPLTLVNVLTYKLNGNVTTNTTRTQYHTPLPSGNVTLTLPAGPSTGGKTLVHVPFNATAIGLQQIFMAANPHINIDVTQSGSAYSGFSWTLTFISPRGNLPLIVADMTNINAITKSASVTALQNGTETQLWFDPVPVYMTEIPLAFSSPRKKVSSVVEVYTNTASGDVIKAACDASGSAKAGFFGLAKGSERDCAFYYSTNKTALINSMNVSRYGANDTAIIYFQGRGFMAGNSSNVTVTVFNATCSVMSMSDSFIYCSVPEVPAGVYKPTVYVPNLGYALYANLSDHLVVTQQVFSYTQVGDSVSGGGNITITGRGFSYHSQVTIAYTNSMNQMVQIPCWNLTAAPAALKCTVPPLPVDAVADLFPQSSSNNFNVMNTSETFEVLIDGRSGSPPNYISYNFASTPYITSSAPIEISFATSTVLNFTGSMLTGVSSVYVGASVCTVQANTDSFLSCMLLRSKKVSQNIMQNVYITVSGLGYAAQSLSVPYEVPLVKRGFHVTGLSTHYGSLYGGNNMTISGVGFLDTDPSHYTVTLVQQNTPSYVDAYNQILLKLGLPPTGTEFVGCYIRQVSRDSITCTIDQTKTTSNLKYVVTVALNNVQSLCADPSVNETDCVYSETTLYSPQVYYMSQLSLSPLNVATFQLHGYLFDPVPLNNKVFIGDTYCTVTAASPTSLTVTSPPLSVPVNGNGVTLGNYSVGVLVANRGYAISNVTMSVPLYVYGVSVSSTSVSIGGGSEIIISGAGFESYYPTSSSKCATANPVFLNITGITKLVPVTTILSCSATELVVSLPNITKFVTASVSVYHVQAIIVSISIYSLSVSSFQLQYSKAASPVVHVPRKYTKGLAYQVISFNVTSPSNPFSDVNTTAFIGGFPCLSLNILHSNTLGSKKASNSSYTCKVPVLDAGFQPLLVNIWPFGYAVTPKYLIPQYESLLQVYSYTPPASFKLSTIGGATVNITGKGFSADTNVTICGTPCYTTNPNYEYVLCQLPTNLLVHDVNVINAMGIKQESLIKSITSLGTLFTSNQNQNAQLPNLNDGDYYTYYSDWQQSCFIGLHMPKGFLVQASRMRFYPRFKYAKFIKTVVFEGSKDYGATYSVLATSNLFIHEGWNFVDTNSTAWYTDLRYRPIADNGYPYCTLAELDFIGTVAWNSTSCAINVTTSNPPQSSSPGSLSFVTIDHSPIVNSIFPNNGTALGGTSIILHGQNLLPTTYTKLMSMQDLAGRVYITLSGVQCAVYFVNSTQIQCVTGPRPPEYVEVSVVQVLVEGYGWALIDDRAEYLYIDKWSALTSWLNQEPPLEGDLVYIPDGQVILLDVNTPILTALIVEGALYFDRSKNLTLDASYVFVNGGLLQVGTHEEPFENQVTITLHGDRYKTIEMPYIGSKVLAVATKGCPMAGEDTGIRIPSRYVGELEIHGKRRLRTWTNLNETAYAGSTIIVTAEPVDFAPGELLVIPGTEPYSGSFDIPHWQIEEVIVEQNLDGHRIVLTAPLLYTHRSEIRWVEERRIDLRCEVALITRNVVVQGDSNSYGQLFGVHTVAMMSGIFRFENAEVRHCGQAFNFGRYCTHSHRGGNMEGSYVKANSIHHSFQRAVTTHDTDNWEVRDNVAYDVQGHTYFVEDGTEKMNSITGNLAILTRRSSALLKSDMKPACFWTATPFNYWYGNKAVHSFHFGMWFEFSGSVNHNPGDQDPNTCPVHNHLGQWFNNTLHNHASIGFRIYPEYTPYNNPCDTNSGTAPMEFYNLTSFRNGGNGLFSKRHGDLHHYNHILLENGGDEISIVKYYNVPYYTNYPTFNNVLAIASLNNIHDAAVGKFAIYAPSLEHFFVSNMTIVNYGAGGAISSCNECLSGENMHQGASTYRFRGMKFVNTSKRILWTETKKDIFWDLDGSLAGKADYMLTPYYAFNNWADCERLPARTFDDTSRCRTIRRLAVDNVTPYVIDYTNLLFKSAVGSQNMYFLPMEITGWVAAVAANHQYSIKWNDSDQSAYQLRVEYGRPEYLTERAHQNRPEQMLFTYSPNRWDYIPYSYQLTYNSKTTLVPINGSRALTNMSRGFYMNNTLETLFTTHGAVLNGWTPFQVNMNSQICPPSGCYIPPPPANAPSTLWSNPKTWGKNGFPTTGSSVVISANMSVVIDINTPALGIVYVYGRLSFLSNSTQPLTLNCQSLIVYGHMEILGKNGTAYPGSATITVTGTKQNSIPVAIGNGIYPGSKVIVVVGTFNAIGTPVATTWTQLKASATVGSSTVVLNTAVTWAVGQQIVLSPTGYYDPSGAAYLDSGSVDIVTIASVVTTGGVTTITTTTPLKQTHLCHSQNGQTFCGYVGLLTRNILIQSKDSETVGSQSYGFGAHFHVIDLATPGQKPAYRSGSLILKNVALKNLGKINSDHMAVTFNYQLTGMLQSASIVSGCAFSNSYNFMVYTIGARSVSIINNVATAAVGGGVYLDKTSLNAVVANNLICMITQLPSYIMSLYPWNRPFGSFMVLTPSAQVYGNVAAGSGDSGFYLVQGLFTNRAPSYVCAATHGAEYSVSPSDVTLGASAWNNEAVGCQVGVTLVTRDRSDAGADDCAVLSGFKVWRNAHAGFMSADTVANVLVANSVIAENHIGISFHFFKFSDDATSGVYSSTFIAILQNSAQATCGLSDSNWVNICRAISASDPLALKNTCNSVLQGSIYQAVGIMLPQWTAGPRTCAMAGRFDVCDPPSTIDRLCALPYNNRYGVPVGIQYIEQVVAATTFIGYSITGCSTHKTAAIALNPDQIDQQPTLMMSQIQWISSSVNARFGFDTSQQAGQCSANPCDGHNFVIIHDFDGSVSGTGAPAQILYNNPEYVAPPPDCSQISALGSGFFYCAEKPVDLVSPVTPVQFRQYAALWHDVGPQVLQPLVVTRDFAASENRSYASFGPFMEECSKQGFFSRYPFALAANTTNHLMTTGTTPQDGWTIRWDAPSVHDSALVTIFIQHPNVINVFVGTSSWDPNPVQATELLDGTFPTLNSPAGLHTRDPQKRTLTVTLRGGPRRFYSFVEVPVIQVTLRMEMSIDDFFSATFIANVATLLGLTASQIKIANVRSGSTIVDFSILPPTTTTTNYTHTITQIHTLRQVARTLNQTAFNGQLQAAVQAPILNLVVTPPVVAIRNLHLTNSTLLRNLTAYMLYVNGLEKQNILMQNQQSGTGPISLTLATDRPTSSPVRSSAAVTLSSPGIISAFVIGGFLLISCAVWFLIVRHLTRKVGAAQLKGSNEREGSKGSKNLTLSKGKVDDAVMDALTYDSPLYDTSLRKQEERPDPVVFSSNPLIVPDSPAAKKAEQVRRKSEPEVNKTEPVRRKSVLDMVHIENPLAIQRPPSITAEPEPEAALEPAQHAEPISPANSVGSALGMAFDYGVRTMISMVSSRALRVSPTTPMTPADIPVKAKRPVPPLKKKEPSKWDRPATPPITFTAPDIPHLTAQEKRKTVGGLAASSMTAEVRKKDQAMKELLQSTDEIRRKSEAL